MEAPGLEADAAVQGPMSKRICPRCCSCSSLRSRHCVKFSGPSWASAMVWLNRRCSLSSARTVTTIDPIRRVNPRLAAGDVPHRARSGRYHPLQNDSCMINQEVKP